MAIKIKIPKVGDKRGTGRFGLPRDPVIRAALVVFLIVLVLGFVALKYL